mgnify:CR=1 FL=1
MFIYTKNKEVIALLEKNNEKLLKKRDDDVCVYVLSPTFKFNFVNQKDTWVSNKMTF